MKTSCTRLSFLSLMVCMALFTGAQLNAQNLGDPVEYLEYFTGESQKIGAQNWEYLSAVAHGKSANKVDKLRNELLTTTLTSIRTISRMPAFEGDVGLRDSAKSYLKTSYDILNEDYAKIVDMEAVAEQSYDAMEAYLLARELANEKLRIAGNNLEEEEKRFAENNNINLLENETELGKKLEIANKVFAYHNDVYLVFFKSYKEEAYLMEAIGTKNIAKIEQHRNALTSYAKEGEATLRETKSFNGDAGIKNAGIELMKFYQKEAAQKIPIMTDFYMKQEKFDKIKKAFDAKREKDRSQEDVDQFNAAVNEVNGAVEKFNVVNDELNVERGNLIDAWNKASADFLHKNTPKK